MWSCLETDLSIFVSALARPSFILAHSVLLISIGFCPNATASSMVPDFSPKVPPGVMLNNARQDPADAVFNSRV